MAQQLKGASEAKGDSGRAAQPPVHALRTRGPAATHPTSTASDKHQTEA